MPVDQTRLRKHLQNFAFEDLFIDELGWDGADMPPVEVILNGDTFIFDAVAEKRGMVVLHYAGMIPGATTRLKIERSIAKAHHEHILIYTDCERTEQIWQWVRREPGKPLAQRTYFYRHGQTGETIVQRLTAVAFEIDEEDALTIVDVTSRVRAAFDLDKVTKRFYDRFKKEHDAFLKFIDGIPAGELERWYASVMLNRLMFIYFVQKKGFLDGDVNYLANKLALTPGPSPTAVRGEGSQSNFYRDFLIPLFFQGFARREQDRTPEARAMLGKIPYLNGGLFMQHQIEELHGEQIQIADAAFERLFAFFDQYRWHLDERPLRAENEINPDVLGYIFEKYINQKQMGAYYTKEDITEYIGKNTVIPFLFDRARRDCRVAFEGEASVWALLQDDPDRYIYPAVRRGADLPLPGNIAAGITDVAQRGDWNTRTPAEYGLPTEIWRETVARRQRYERVRARLADGDLREINDLITENLDIQQFAQDVIDNCEGPELLRAFWKAILNVTVLDPTCGSGAFLFAAINILEPLYDACLDRMEGFIDEAERTGAPSSKYKDFREVMASVAQHPNRRYFVLKSIIVNNLYGVDIMDEAVEIAKLRMFLKLVAQVDDPDRIEPLPDIDFNIRAGNTLVGFATEQEVTGRLFATPELKRQIEAITRDLKNFRELQTQLDIPAELFASAKRAIQGKLHAVRDALDESLMMDYGQSDLEKFRQSHKPFHWYVEFNEIMSGGGFDVVIGNPPYVQYRKVQRVYAVREFATEKCGDLYAFVMEQSIKLASQSGSLGMIVPVSIVSTDGFSDLRKFMHGTVETLWTASFAERPSKLFTGVEKRLTTWVAQKGLSQEPKLWLSNYKRWFADERPHLFSRMSFVLYRNERSLIAETIPKIKSPTELAILRRLASNTPLQNYLSRAAKYIVFYTRKLRYFVQFFDFVPRITDAQGNVQPPSELKEVRLASETHRNAVIAALNSNLFFWFLSIHSDVRNVNKREIISFPFSLTEISAEILLELDKLSRRLMEDFTENSRVLTGNYGHGVLNIQSFQPRLSKPIIDEIDRVLAQHYGFTDEELDFIINYDIKYRMGKDLFEGGDA